MPRQLTPQEATGLWGDGGPYSQVQVVREIRILDNSVSRTFYRVTANINPTSFQIMKKLKGQIRDEVILGCLAQAKFTSREEGYVWHVYGEPSDRPHAANRVAKLATAAIIHMHQLVMQELGKAPGSPGGNAR